MEVGTAGHATTERPPRMTREERIVLGALVLVGLGIRIYAGTVQRMPEFDGTFYVHYFRVPGWHWVFPPGYPMVIEIARLVIADGVTAARVVSALWGALLAVPLFVVARHYVSTLLALAAAFLAEINPLLIRQSAMAQSEMQYVALVLLAFMLWFQRRKFAAGLAAGAAYLTRPEAIAVFGALWLYDAIRFRQMAGLGRLLAGFLLLSLPYIAYLRISTGEWTVSPKTMNIRERGADLSEALQMESLEYQPPSLSERLRDGIVHYPSRLMLYLGYLWTYAGIAACLLALAGLAAGKPGPLLCGLVVLAILPLFGLKVEQRFVVPYVPFVILLAVLAVGMLRAPWLAASAVALAALAVVPTMGFMIAPEDPAGIEFVEAGKAMRPITSPGDLYLDRKPFVAFYAGGSYRNLPNDSLPAVVTYGREVKAKYIVLSESVLRLFRPKLKDVLRNDSLLAQWGLRTVYQKGLGTGYGVRIVSMNR